MEKTLTALITITLACVALADTTLTIIIPSADEARVAAAFGSDLGRPANQAEIQKSLQQWIAGQTQEYERRKNMVQFTPSPLKMQSLPTPAPQKAAVPTATPKKKK